MRYLQIIGAILVVLIVVFMAYVRFSPMPMARWHVPIQSTASANYPGGAVRVLAGDAGVLTQFDRALAALPRTQLLAGSPAQGRITYITRSAFFGFPDITTLELRDDEVALYGRLRFGLSDMGVNRKRLEGLIATVQGG